MFYQDHSIISGDTINCWLQLTQTTEGGEDDTDYNGRKREGLGSGNSWGHNSVTTVTEKKNW